MLIGINVNHDRTKNVSTVGVAATYDRDFVRVNSFVAYQKQGVELIERMDTWVKNAIQKFKQINGIHPEQIIVYRDGVSSTQIEAVVNQEIAACDKAIKDEIYNCDENNKNNDSDDDSENNDENINNDNKSKSSRKNKNKNNNKPQKKCLLEFITCQKRVNARFILNANKTTAPPGTAINTDVVSNQYWDFYIVPAKPPENCVAIPTRFTVLRDDLELGKDGEGEHDLMTFTNQLCSLYFNWPGNYYLFLCVF